MIKFMHELYLQHLSEQKKASCREEQDAKGTKPRREQQVTLHNI
jgi:hypothetical protein